MDLKEIEEKWQKKEREQKVKKDKKEKKDKKGKKKRKTEGQSKSAFFSSIDLRSCAILRSLLCGYSFVLHKTVR